MSIFKKTQCPIFLQLWKEYSLTSFTCIWTPKSDQNSERGLKVDMPILRCIYFIFNWLTLTSEMHFVKFHPEVASCLHSRGKRKYAPLGMRLLWKYINYFLVYHLITHFLLYLQTTKNLKLKFWICNQKNMGFHLISKSILLPVEPWGWECDRHKGLWFEGFCTLIHSLPYI